MANEIEVGAILEGKVTGITKYGAFVSLPGGKSGLVHISEIAYSYVSEVGDFLSDGQDVKVKVVSIDENNRINLSIKRALPPPPRNGARGGGGSRSQNNSRPSSQGASRERTQNSRGSSAQSAPSSEQKTFDDMLKQFMSDSDSKLSGRYTDKSTRRRGSGGRHS